jgi:hypothetical protein
MTEIGRVGGQGATQERGIKPKLAGSPKRKAVGATNGSRSTEAVVFDSMRAKNGTKSKATVHAAKNGRAGSKPEREAPSRAAAERAAPSRPSSPPRANGTNGTGRLHPIKARPSRSEREFAEARAREIDDVCAAWAAIVAERMAADQIFAETFEAYQNRPGDLRGLFLWDALHSAEAHVALVNAVIARHLEGSKADPFAILSDLRAQQRKIAVLYAVNAFMAVLNQMSPIKPKWLSFDALDPRMAVLALAHQSLEKALEAARIEAPADLTEQILQAAQDESVWTGARDASDRTLAACAASAAFFRLLGGTELGSIDEIVAIYEARSAR